MTSSGISLVCPTSRQTLDLVDLGEAQQRMSAGLLPLPRAVGAPDPVGVTNRVLLRRDQSGAYPILDDVPVLLGPELLVPEGAGPAVDLQLPQYAEAYAEMDFYNSGVIADASMMKTLDELVRGLDTLRPESFPHDWRRWLDAKYDCLAQWDCYRHMGQLTGHVAMQVGGAGLHAVKFLLAGAREAILVTPMITEAKRAQWAAERVGVADRLTVLLGVAEELPLEDDQVDAIFSGGCVHHMVMEQAMPEISRILSPGGTFAAAEPWRAPLYNAGTRIFGKREANAHCTPLANQSVDSLAANFKVSRVVHHGALLRYPLIAMSKLGVRPPLGWLFRIFRVDDRLSDALVLRRFGSSVALLARK